MYDDDLPNGFTGFANRNLRTASSTPTSAQNNEQQQRSAEAAAPAPLGSYQYARDHEAPIGEPMAYTEDQLDNLTERDKRWAWVEIDRAALRNNVIQVKRKLQGGCRLMAIVKADAYGHGAVECSKVSLAAGADQLGVATVDEAVELRKAGITAPLLILAQPPASSIPLLVAYHIMPSVYDPEFAVLYGEAADQHGLTAPYHLALNTGMNRIGVRFDEAVEFLRQVSFHRALDLTGVFTHFATADCPETLDFRRQVRRFTEAVSSIREAGIDPGIVHAANSAAILRYPDVHFDMVRLGISLYGFHPCPETHGTIDLHPVMSVHARVTDERLLPMSEGVSYGLHYRSPGSVKICTIPLGYADGLRRGLSGRTDVIYQGHYFRQVGNICMDQCMFEVDLRSYGSRQRIIPQIGDEVLVVGCEGAAAVTIDEMAEKLGTIQHEISIGFSQRMPRIFV